MIFYANTKGVSMRNAWIGLITALLIAGCANAQPRPPKAIPDVEPEVTAQVGTILASASTDQLAPELLTDNLKAALGPDALRQMGAALRACGPAPALELLERTTKGEDRQYVYRVLCGGKPLLATIHFNKGARVNQLRVRPE
jgi:hypothetical protein